MLAITNQSRSERRTGKGVSPPGDRYRKCSHRKLPQAQHKQGEKQGREQDDPIDRVHAACKLQPGQAPDRGRGDKDREARRETLRQLVLTEEKKGKKTREGGGKRAQTKQ